MKWWNNGQKNVRSEICPGEEFTSGRLAFSRKPATEDTKRRISESLCGKPAWNKGVKTGPEPDWVKKKKSDSAFARDNSPYGGKLPWNHGLTSEDSRVAAYQSKQAGQTRAGNYASGENHPGYNSNRSEFLRYRYQVGRLTEQTYATYMADINPRCYPRTLAGVEGGYQLDHVKSIWQGFQDDIAAEEIASKYNLQMLPWLDNLKKSK